MRSYRSFKQYGMLISEPILNLIKKMIKGKYDEKCNDSDLLKSINQIMAEKINAEMVRPFKTSKSRERGRKRQYFPGHRFQSFQ